MNGSGLEFGEFGIKPDRKRQIIVHVFTAGAVRMGNLVLHRQQQVSKSRRGIELGCQGQADLPGPAGITRAVQNNQVGLLIINDGVRIRFPVGRVLISRPRVPRLNKFTANALHKILQRVINRHHLDR